MFNLTTCARLLFPLLFLMIDLKSFCLLLRTSLFFPFHLLSVTQELCHTTYLTDPAIFRLQHMKKCDVDNRHICTG